MKNAVIETFVTTKRMQCSNIHFALNNIFLKFIR